MSSQDIEYKKLCCSSNVTMIRCHFLFLFVFIIVIASAIPVNHDIAQMVENGTSIKVMTCVVVLNTSTFENCLTGACSPCPRGPTCCCPSKGGIIVPV